MPRRSCERTCPLWWAPLVMERGGAYVGGPSRGAPGWLAGEQGTGGPFGEHLGHNDVWGGWPGAVVHQVGRAGAGGRLVRAFHKYRDFVHFQLLVWQM